MSLDISCPPHTHDKVPEILDRCRKMVGPALREAIDRLHPDPGHMAAFTFGWCEADGTPRPDTHGGKGLRPAIAMLCGRAAGASPESAVSGAVAVELVHAFSLVHDDIMDGDERRRHRETVWKAYGVGPAVLAGDALLALALDTLARADAARAPEAMGELSRTLIELVHGQADDLAFEDRPWDGPDAVTVEEYHAMAARKTGSLWSCAAAVGVLLGGGSSALATAMAEMGRHLGLAFQAVDDLLGIWGDPERTGKPVYSDLRQGKKTLPVLVALAAGTARSTRLIQLLGDRSTDGEAVRQAAELIVASGGAAATQEHAVQHLNAALRIIDDADLDRAAAAELATLSQFAVHRSR